METGAVAEESEQVKEYSYDCHCHDDIADRLGHGELEDDPDEDSEDGERDD